MELMKAIVPLLALSLLLAGCLAADPGPEEVEPPMDRAQLLSRVEGVLGAAERAFEEEDGAGVEAIWEGQWPDIEEAILSWDYGFYVDETRASINLAMQDALRCLQVEDEDACDSAGWLFQDAWEDLEKARECPDAGEYC